MELFYPKQTNLGLFVQLRERGFSHADIIRVRDAYLIACKMFNGRYRKNSRAFICHAVGAASASAQYTDQIEIIIASLLHAAYDGGQFPDGRVGKITDAHRQWLKNEVGTVVEAILVRLQQFDFEMGDPEKIVEKGIKQRDEDLLFMALAHEIDDMVDGGLAVVQKYGGSIEKRVEACAILARRIGEEDIAKTLEAHGKFYSEYDWMKSLDQETRSGFWIVPNFRAYIRHLKRARRKVTALIF